MLLALFMIINVWFLLLYLALQETYWSLLFESIFLTELLKEICLSELEAGLLMLGRSYLLALVLVVLSDLLEELSNPNFVYFIFLG